MQVHHLNCGTFCPFEGHFTDGVTQGVGATKLVCHCLLIETDDGLVLVDTVNEARGLTSSRQSSPEL